MPTMHQHRKNTATLLTTVGHLNPDATPAQRDAAADLTDDQVEAMATELLYRLGAGEIHHPAAA